MKIKSRVEGRAIIIQFPDSPERGLLVDIVIDCPVCGTHALRLAGHHLRAVRNLCTEFVDLHPDLCGDEAGLEVVKRLTFSGEPPQDPERN